MLSNYVNKQYFFNLLEKEFSDIHTVLELGAGTSSYLRTINGNFEITAVDVHQPSLDKAKANNVYNHYICANIQKMRDVFKQNQFDAVVAFDVLEHFPKDDGYQLLKDMEYIAAKKVVVYTPNGFLYQPPFDNNPFQEHKSGWSYSEMKKLNFNVFGINGWKHFRTTFASPTIKPAKLGTLISDISWVIIKACKLDIISFGILCIKNKQK